MPVSVLRPSAPRSRGLVPVLAVLVAVLAALGLTRPADAGSPAPTATQITVTALSTPGITVPQTIGAPKAFVVAGVPFTVETKFTAADGVTALPLSTNQVATVKLVVASGPDAGDSVGSVDVPAGATAATIDATIDQAANSTSLIAKAFIKKQEQVGVLPGAPFFFSPQKAFVSAAADSLLTSIGPGPSASEPCQPTAQEPTCAELRVPNVPAVPGDPAVLSEQLLSLGACDAAGSTSPTAVTCTTATQSVVQALVAVDPDQINNDHPLTLVLKCDKTACGGSGVNKVPVKVALEPDDPGTTPPACLAKGQVQSGTSFCIDYRQSTRDNFGDTHLWILLGEDARVWNG